MTSWDAFRAAWVRVFILRSWGTGTLKRSALVTWHLLCHLTSRWPLYKSESVLSRKAYLETGWLGEPIGQGLSAIADRLYGKTTADADRLLRPTDVKCRRPKRQVVVGGSFLLAVSRSDFR